MTYINFISSNLCSGLDITFYLYVVHIMFKRWTLFVFTTLEESIILKCQVVVLIYVNTALLFVVLSCGMGFQLPLRVFSVLVHSRVIYFICLYIIILSFFCR